MNGDEDALGSHKQRKETSENSASHFGIKFCSIMETDDVKLGKKSISQSAQALTVITSRIKRGKTVCHANEVELEPC